MSIVSLRRAATRGHSNEVRDTLYRRKVAKAGAEGGAANEDEGVAEGGLFGHAGVAAE